VIQLGCLFQELHIDISWLIDAVTFENHGFASLRSDIYCLVKTPSWSYRLPSESTATIGSFCRIAVFILHVLCDFSLKEISQTPLVSYMKSLIDGILFAHAISLLYEEEQLEARYGFHLEEELVSSKTMIDAFYKSIHHEIEASLVVMIKEDSHHHLLSENTGRLTKELINATLVYSNLCPLFLRILEMQLGSVIRSMEVHETARIMLLDFLQQESSMSNTWYLQYLISRYHAIIDVASTSSIITKLISEHRGVSVLMGWLIRGETIETANFYLDWFLTWCVTEQRSFPYRYSNHIMYFFFSLAWRSLVPQVSQEYSDVIREALCTEITTLKQDERSAEFYYLADMFEQCMKKRIPSLSSSLQSQELPKSVLDASRRWLSLYLRFVDLQQDDNTTTALPKSFLDKIVNAVSTIPSTIVVDECPVEKLALCLQLGDCRDHDGRYLKAMQLGYHWLVDLLEPILITEIEQKISTGNEFGMPQAFIQILHREASMKETTTFFYFPVAEDEKDSFLIDLSSHDHAISVFLTWMVIVRLVSLASRPEIRMGLIEDLKGEFDAFSHLLELVFHYLDLDTNRPFNMGSIDLTAVLQNHPYTMSLDSLQAISLLALQVYGGVLKTLPAMVRQWWLHCKDRPLSLAVERFTETYFSLRLIYADIDLLQREMQEKRLFGDTFTVRINRSSREITAFYKIDDITLQLAIRWPPNFPLKPVPVIDLTGSHLGSASEIQSQRWLMLMRNLLNVQNGSVVDVLWLWKQNLDRRLEGIEPCTICYSIIHSSNKSLPQQQCKVCTHRFHSICLVSPLLFLVVWLDRQMFL
jgi:hypothetical protein